MIVGVVWDIVGWFLEDWIGEVMLEWEKNIEKAVVGGHGKFYNDGMDLTEALFLRIPLWR